jgi:hypothetical protein
MSLFQRTVKFRGSAESDFTFGWACPIAKRTFCPYPIRAEGALEILLCRHPRIVKFCVPKAASSAREGEANVRRKRFALEDKNRNAMTGRFIRNNAGHAAYRR